MSLEERVRERIKIPKREETYQRASIDKWENKLGVSRGIKCLHYQKKVFNNVIFGYEYLVIVFGPLESDFDLELILQRGAHNQRSRDLGCLNCRELISCDIHYIFIGTLIQPLPDLGKEIAFIRFSVSRCFNSKVKNQEKIINRLYFKITSQTSRLGYLTIIPMFSLDFLTTGIESTGFVHAYCLGLSWAIKRLIWIGRLKEDESYCNITKLPKEIVTYLISFLDNCGFLSGKSVDQ